MSITSGGKKTKFVGDSKHQHGLSSAQKMGQKALKATEKNFPELKGKMTVDKNGNLIGKKAIFDDKTGALNGSWQNAQGYFKQNITQQTSASDLKTQQLGINKAVGNYQTEVGNLLKFKNQTIKDLNTNIKTDKMNNSANMLSNNMQKSISQNQNLVDSGTGLRSALNNLTNAGVSESSGGAKQLMGMASNIANKNNLADLLQARAKNVQSTNDMRQDINKQNQDKTGARQTYFTKLNDAKTSLAQTLAPMITKYGEDYINAGGTHMQGINNMNNRYYKLTGIQPYTPDKTLKPVQPAQMSVKGANNATATPAKAQPNKTMKTKKITKKK
jgi:hypothetical protein